MIAARGLFGMRWRFEAQKTKYSLQCTGHSLVILFSLYNPLKGAACDVISPLDVVTPRCKTPQQTGSLHKTSAANKDLTRPSPFW